MVRAWQLLQPAPGLRSKQLSVGTWLSSSASCASAGWQVSRKGVCVLAKSWWFKEMHGS